MEFVKDYFQGHFPLASYSGTYGSEESHIARRDFSKLTNNIIMWSQVHGDFKNVAKRAIFVPYPHWTELYQACCDVLREHATLETYYSGEPMLAKIMGDAMAVLRAKYGHNAPKWWLPIMNQLRGNKR